MVDSVTSLKIPRYNIAMSALYVREILHENEYRCFPSRITILQVLFFYCVRNRETVLAERIIASFV